MCLFRTSAKWHNMSTDERKEAVKQYLTLRVRFYKFRVWWRMQVQYYFWDHVDPNSKRARWLASRVLPCKVMEPIRTSYKYQQKYKDKFIPKGEVVVLYFYQDHCYCFHGDRFVWSDVINVKPWFPQGMKCCEEAGKNGVLDWDLFTLDMDEHIEERKRQKAYVMWDGHAGMTPAIGTPPFRKE